MLADLLYLSAICCNVNILIMSIDPIKAKSQSLMKTVYKSRHMSYSVLQCTEL